MTVGNLIEKAVAMIDDTQSLTDYNAGYFVHASNIVADCINSNIGCETKKFIASVDGDETLALPTDLTEDEQIVDISLYNAREQYSLSTETVDGVFYLLMPTGYYGDVVVSYKPATPDFSALSDVVPLSTGAINGVAVFGLAAALAVSNDPQKVTYYEQKYAEAKKAWKPRGKYKVGHIIDVYGY